MVTSSGADTTTVVLTAEGRARLETRLTAAREQFEDVQRQLVGNNDKAELLADRHRLRDRIVMLEDALARSVSVDAVDEDPDIIELGDEVDLEFDDGERDTIVIVHPLEADADRNHVSVAAPLAEALMGRRIGDEVSVAAPMGSYPVRVLDRRRSN